MSDVVDRPIDDPADERVSKRVCRLNSKNAVFGLELVEYPDCHEATLHVLDSNDWTEADQTYVVDSGDILDQQVPWVVVTNSTSTYDFPDPCAAAYGEAAPACDVGDDDTDYRITRISTVYPAYGGCKDCVRRAKPVELQPVHCPECEKAICHGMLQQVAVAAIDGLSISCPPRQFGDVADLKGGRRRVDRGSNAVSETLCACTGPPPPGDAGQHGVDEDAVTRCYRADLGWDVRDGVCSE